jgi:UDP-N-acetylmuramoyl-tripeptide--D-alanyl-D-alanine ligase
MAARTSARVLTYSMGGAGAPRADLVAERIEVDAELRPRFVARTPWGSQTVRLAVHGVHQVGNALAGLAVAGAMGVPITAATEALARASISPWRMQLERTPGGAVVINDAYNANPASMKAALEALATVPARRRVAVLGPMAELGSHSAAEHAAVADLAQRLGVKVLAVATDAYGAPAVTELDDAVAALGWLGPGDAVLVKASRVAGLERLAARLVAGESSAEASFPGASFPGASSSGASSSGAASPGAA